MPISRSSAVTIFIGVCLRAWTAWCLLVIPLLLMFAEYSVDTSITKAAPARAQHAAPLHSISRRSVPIVSQAP